MCRVVLRRPPTQAAVSLGAVLSPPQVQLICQLSAPVLPQCTDPQDLVLLLSVVAACAAQLPLAGLIQHLNAHSGGAAASGDAPPAAAAGDAAPSPPGPWLLWREELRQQQQARGGGGGGGSAAAGAAQRAVEALVVQALRRLQPVLHRLQPHELVAVAGALQQLGCRSEPPPPAGNLARAVAAGAAGTNGPGMVNSYPITVVHPSTGAAPPAQPLPPGGDAAEQSEEEQEEPAAAALQALLSGPAGFYQALHAAAMAPKRLATFADSDQMADLLRPMAAMRALPGRPLLAQLADALDESGRQHAQALIAAAAAAVSELQQAPGASPSPSPSPSPPPSSSSSSDEDSAGGARGGSRGPARQRGKAGGAAPPPPPPRRPRPYRLDPSLTMSDHAVCMALFLFSVLGHQPGVRTLRAAQLQLSRSWASLSSSDLTCAIWAFACLDDSNGSSSNSSSSGGAGVSTVVAGEQQKQQQGGLRGRGAGEGGPGPGRAPAARAGGSRTLGDIAALNTANASQRRASAAGGRCGAVRCAA